MFLEERERKYFLIRLTKFAFLKKLFSIERSDKMTVRLEARIDENTMKKLENMKDETGLSKTEIIEDLIKYSNVSDFKMLTPTAEEKEEENKRIIQLIATRKYLAYLYKNSTNNINQIAKVLNKYGINEDNQSNIEQLFIEMKFLNDVLTNKVKEMTKND